MDARASTSTARRWRTGSDKRRFCSRLWPRRSAATSGPAPSCTPTTPPCRCWPLASARPGPDGSGSWCATNGPGVRTCRRRRSTATRPTAAVSTPRRSSAPAAGSCTPTATPGSTRSMLRSRRQATRPWSRFPAGAMRVASSTTSTTRPPRRSRSRPCSASPPCSPSKAASRGRRPNAAPPCARNTPARCSTNSRCFSTSRSPGSAARARWQGPSATPCRDGRRSAATPPTAGWRCPTMPPSVP